MLTGECFETQKVFGDILVHVVGRGTPKNSNWATPKTTSARGFRARVYEA